MAAADMQVTVRFRWWMTGLFSCLLWLHGRGLLPQWLRNAVATEGFARFVAKRGTSYWLGSRRI